MHELSICQGLISTVENEFSVEELERIREVHLKVGLLSGVEPELIKRAYEFMIVDTKLQHSSLHFDRVDVLVMCAECAAPFKVISSRFICPVCGKPSNEIIEGKELKIYKIISIV